MKLVVPEADGSECVRPLALTTTIGRGSRNDVVLPDIKVSRQHAVIHVQGDGTRTLLDLGSANGTFLNGRRIVLPARLNPDDRIRVGTTSLRLVEDPDGEGSSVTDSTFVDPPTLVAFEKSELTVLVADVRGYTSLSEVLSLEQLGEAMGGWFRRVTGLVLRRGGSVENFAGDCVMAVWRGGAPGTDPIIPVAEAIGTAVDIQHDCEGFSRSLPWWPADRTFRVGVGINTGTALSGTFGTGGRREFSSAGDAVNVAFRIEPLTKRFPYPILASGPTVRRCEGRFPFVPLGPVELKGKAEPVDIHGLDPATVGS